jgi:hypothetical protein
VTADRELLRVAAEEIEILGRCLQVDALLERWAGDKDHTSGCIAADGLDQALGLLDELADGRAAELAAAVRRITSTLPPPLE